MKALHTNFTSSKNSKKMIEILFFILGIIFSAFLVYLNIMLMFDNVVWGDEAYSANTVWNTDLHGIFERTFYLDSHPPLYYYWLRIFLDLFGKNTWAFHLASVIPYILGIVVVLCVYTKKLGLFPSLFFVLIASLSESCIQYNLEIRMYSLVFFFILLCFIFCYYILTEEKKLAYWIGLVLSCTLAAYTHYYGLIVSGVLLVVTSFIYFLMHKGKSWLYGLCSLLAYIILYAPWLVVLFKQMQRVSAGWWMTQPETLTNVLTFIFCGSKLKYILLPTALIITLIVLACDCYLIHKKKTSTLSAQSLGIILGWTTIVLVLISAYTISYVFKPILARRYTYPLIPVMLSIYVLCISRIIAFGRQYVKKWLHGIILCCFCALFITLGYVSYSDYKFYKELADVLDYHTNRVLDTIGTPNTDTVFTAYDVKHLAWTVLAYYYPQNTILGQLPYEIEGNPDDIWAFIGTPLTDEQLAVMEEGNYSVEIYPDMWLSQYHCELYHFYR